MSVDKGSQCAAEGPCVAFSGGGARNLPGVLGLSRRDLLLELGSALFGRIAPLRVDQRVVALRGENISIVALRCDRFA